MKELPKDIAAAEGKVNVQINGVWHRFPRGMRIIEACTAVGVHIPRFCYHPKLMVAGSCRMCLVEQGMPARLAPGQVPQYDEQGYQAIQWMPRAIIACANTVAENMGINTESKLTQEVRRGVMEFLLTSHPLDCPICDQAGECTLQEYSNDHGQGTARFTEAKTKKGKQLDIGPRIILDQERCVLCGRCVRFMRDIMKDPVLTMSQRGTNNAITIYPGRELDNNYSLNTVDLCPVGALTSKDFRFKMRVWFLKETDSIDQNCGTGSNITIWSRDGEVYRITPRQNDDVNSCWMPDSHRLNYKFINAETRIPQPVMRSDIGAPHRPAVWDASINAVAESLKKIPADKLAVIASGRMTNEELYLTRKIINVLGTENVATVPRSNEADGKLINADGNPNTLGAKVMLSMENPSAKLDHIREAVRMGSIKGILVIGEDLTEAAGFNVDDLKQLDYLATICHSASLTAKNADVVLPGVSFAEKFGTMINVAGRIQCLNRAFMPLGDAREDWSILRDLGLALGCGCKNLPMYTSALDVLARMSTKFPELTGMTWEAIGSQGKQIIDTGVNIPSLG